MAAGEYQAEPVVGKLVVHGRVAIRSAGGVLFRLQQSLQNFRFVPKYLVTPKPVDGPAAGRGDDPGVWCAGDAVIGPALQGDGQGVLQGVLGELKIAAAGADQRGGYSRGMLADYRLDGCGDR